MSPLTVKVKNAEITSFNTFGFKTINPNKSDNTKFTFFKEKSFNLLLGFLKIHKMVYFLQVPIWFDFGE